MRLPQAIEKVVQNLPQFNWVIGQALEVAEAVNENPSDFPLAQELVQFAVWVANLLVESLGDVAMILTLLSLTSGSKSQPKFKASRSI